MSEGSIALLAVANFLAAFGGGTLLGKGMSVIDVRRLQGGSLLALVAGTPIGLAWLMLIPQSTLVHSIGWLSISGGLLSLILLALFARFQLDGKLHTAPAVIFFLLLVLRFSFWFVSRGLRSDAVSGREGLIGWVELLYYAGMTLGLLMWMFLPEKVGRGVIGMLLALTLDSTLQIGAGFLDLTSGVTGVPSATPDTITSAPFDWGWYGRLTLSIAAFTIGTQIVLFDYAHRLNDQAFANSIGCPDGEKHAHFVTAVFYSGVAVAASILAFARLRLVWPGDYWEISALALVQLVIMLFWWTGNVRRWSRMFGLLLAFGSAVLYEIIALQLLDDIGRSGKAEGWDGLVAVSLCFVGIAAAISLWFMTQQKPRFQSWFSIYVVSTGLALAILIPWHL